MTRLWLSFTLLIFLVGYNACTTPEVVEEPVPANAQFHINADRYSLSHYFVDTAYIRHYEPFYGNIPPVVLDPGMQIVEAEVWIQDYSPLRLTAVAWMNLPSRPAAGYDSTYRLAPAQPGLVEPARFSRLDPHSYRLDGWGYIGVITLRGLDPVPDVAFAVAYRRADGTQYGEFARDRSEDTTGTPMVLKMVKPALLFSRGPAYTPAWDMLLKCIYSIHHGHVSRHQFQFDIFRTDDGNSDQASLQGFRLLHILGLDRFDASGVPLPQGDGSFDFFPPVTIIQDDGDVIFPRLRPFDTAIREYFASRGLPPPPDAVFFPELYDSTQAVARLAAANRYRLKGSGVFD